MPGAQRKTTAVRRPRPAPRPEYVAAIRYPDGRRDLFHIRNATDLDDARTLVIAEVGEVSALVIALRH